MDSVDTVTLVATPAWAESYTWDTLLREAAVSLVINPVKLYVGVKSVGASRVPSYGLVTFVFVRVGVSVLADIEAATNLLVALKA